MSPRAQASPEALPRRSRRIQQSFRALRLVVSAVAVAVASWGAVHTFGAFRTAEWLTHATAVSETSTRLAAAQALERGLTAAAGGKAGATEGELQRVRAARADVDRLFQETHRAALELLRLDPAAMSSVVARCDERRGALEQGRAEVDRALAARAPIDAAPWLSAAGEMVDVLAELRVRAFSPTAAGATPQSQLMVRELALEAAERAGRERAMVGLAIAAGRPLSPGEQEALTRHRVAVEEALRRLDRFATDPRADDPRVRAAVQTLQEEFLRRFEQVRRPVLEAGRRGEPYPLTAEQWLAEATRGIGAIHELATVVAQVGREDVERRRDEARRFSVGLAVAGVVLLLGTTLGGTLVRRRVVAPLARLHEATTSIAAGDLETPVHSEHEDELGELARAFDQMRGSLLEHRRTQQELIGRLSTAQHELVRSERLAALGQLASGAAHEINNPLAVVASSTDFAREQLDEALGLLEAFGAAAAQGKPEALTALGVRLQRLRIGELRQDVASALEDSAKAAERIRLIVAQLATFGGQRAVPEQVLDLRRELEATLDLTSGTFPGVELVRELGPTGSVRMAAADLHPILLALVRNAADAMAGRGTLTIRSGEGDGECWFEVEDTGTGIAPEHLPRLFEPFFTTKGVGGGTGLGLSTAHGVLCALGGRLTLVRTEPGKGSTFRATLPVVRAASEGPTAHLA